MEDGNGGNKNQKKIPRSFRSYLWPILGAALGLLLLYLGSGNRLDGLGVKKQEAPSDAEGGETDEVAAYILRTEERIAALCRQVEGVGTVYVAVQVDGDFTNVYATDRQVRENGSSDSYVTVGSGAGQSPVLLTRTPPTIVGIGIVCEGGDDARVRQELIGLLGAAFGVGSNKIYIAAAGPGTGAAENTAAKNSAGGIFAPAASYNAV